MEVLLYRSARSGDLSQVTKYSAADWHKYKKEAAEHLLWSCSYGHLQVAQWLHNIFSLTPDEARAHNNDALYWACANGHLNVGRWLHTTFGLTATDARTRHNQILFMACEGGRMPIAPHNFWVDRHGRK